MSEPKGYRDTSVFRPLPRANEAEALVRKNTVIMKLREALSRTGNRDAQLMLNKLIRDIQEL